MCLAIPGKIIEIKNKTAIVDYGDVKRQAKIIHGNYQTGDRVIVSNKIVVEKISNEDEPREND